MTEQLSFTTTFDRDALGRVAHGAFCRWAMHHVKTEYRAAYAVAWESLPERQREAYRVAAEAVAKTVQGRQV